MMKGGVEVDQVKIGNFLKKLRKEKGITQELQPGIGSLSFVIEKTSPIFSFIFNSFF